MAGFSGLLAGACFAICFLLCGIALFLPSFFRGVSPDHDYYVSRSVGLGKYDSYHAPAVWVFGLAGVPVMVCLAFVFLPFGLELFFRGLKYPEGVGFASVFLCGVGWYCVFIATYAQLFWLVLGVWALFLIARFL